MNSRPSNEGRNTKISEHINVLTLSTGPFWELFEFHVKPFSMIMDLAVVCDDLLDEKRRV